MLILNRTISLVAALLLSQTNCTLIRADERPEPSTVQVVALDDTAITFTIDQLRNLPRTSVEVTDRTGRIVKYTGVAVHQLLNEVKAPLGEELRGEALRCYVAVRAKDEYRVVFALCEFDPSMTDRTILLADEQDGKPLSDENGPFQLIVPGEKRRARWVRQVNRIRVMESRVVDEDMPTTVATQD